MVEFKDFMESWKAFYKMGYSIGRTNMELTKLAVDSFGNMYEIFVRQFMPSEVADNLRKSIGVYMESQSKVFDNFRKLVDQLERQFDDVFDRMIEFSQRSSAEAKTKK